MSFCQVEHMLERCTKGLMRLEQLFMIAAQLVNVSADLEVLLAVDQ